MKQILSDLILGIDFFPDILLELENCLVMLKKRECELDGLNYFSILPAFWGQW